MDDFVLNNLGEYRGKKFKSIEAGDVGDVYVALCDNVISKLIVVQIARSQMPCLNRKRLSSQTGFV